MSIQVSTISPRQIHEERRRGRYTPVLDARSVAEYRAGHVPDAQLIPVDSLSADALAHAFKRPGLGHEETLYITCFDKLSLERQVQTAVGACGTRHAA